MAESTLFENLRAFAKQRLRTLELFPDYLKSVIERWNEIFFLSVPTLPFVAWWYLGEPPMWIRVGVFLWVLVFAGYYAWRKDHLRLMPKMKFADSPFCFHEQSTNQSEERLYLQLRPECATGVEVDGCKGYLQRVMRWDGVKWEPTQYESCNWLNVVVSKPVQSN